MCTPSKAARSHAPTMSKTGWAPPASCRHGDQVFGAAFTGLILRGRTPLRAAVSKDGRVLGVAPIVPVPILRDALQSATADCNAPQDEVRPRLTSPADRAAAGT